MKRILALLTALALLLGCAAAETAEAPEAAAPQIEMKTYPLYLLYKDQTWPEDFPLYFVDGVNDLPYVDLFDWAKVLNWLYPAMSDELFAGYQVTAEQGQENDRVSYTRENSHTALFDFTNGTITWDDYMGFLRQTVGSYMDLTGISPAGRDGAPFLLATVNTKDRYGEITTVDLAKYGIRMIAQDGKYLVPLQTMSAFFITPYQAGCYFNQQALFLCAISDLKDPNQALLLKLMTAGLLTTDLIMEAQAIEGGQAEKMNYIMNKIMSTEEGMAVILEFKQKMEKSVYPLYFAGPKGERSEQLTAYGFVELCLELDSFYGLREAHNIKDFHMFFLENGLATDLLNPDPGKADSAIAALTQYWIDDGHSGFTSPSYLTQSNPAEGIDFGLDSSARQQAGQTAQMYRARYPEARQGYYEVGNTAYVTFDNFLIGEDGDKIKDYYALAESGNLPNDTLGLIIKAHQQITRENSPIENVVLDLSCNGGGAAPAAVFVLGWFLGNAQVSIQNPFTDSESTTVYRADVNLDHEFDERDTVSHLNLYCLISPTSFSCGNLVPWAFKADGRVTLLGKVSGGGACVVQPMTTAWGTSFQISGIKRISFTKNGAYYDVDQGVEPDYFIRSYDHFFDREKLTEFINGLY